MRLENELNDKNAMKDVTDEDRNLLEELRESLSQRVSELLVNEKSSDETAVNEGNDL